MIAVKILPLFAPKAHCERDSSGTTEGQTKCSPKVMERIARRKPNKKATNLVAFLLGEAARPNYYKLSHQNEIAIEDFIAGVVEFDDVEICAVG